MATTKPTLVFTYEIHADRQRVFDVLTQPLHLNRYFTSNASVELKVGGRYSNSDGESGKLLKFAEPRLLVCTYTHDKLGLETEVEISLEPSRPLGWTRFRLVQKGLDPQKITPEAYAWMTARWQFLAATLKRYVSGESKLAFDRWQAQQKPVYEQRP